MWWIATWRTWKHLLVHQLEWIFCPICLKNLARGLKNCQNGSFWVQKSYISEFGHNLVSRVVRSLKGRFFVNCTTYMCQLTILKHHDFSQQPLLGLRVRWQTFFHHRFVVLNLLFPIPTISLYFSSYRGFLYTKAQVSVIIHNFGSVKTWCL